MDAQWVAPDYGESFGDVWYDGKAEMASYDLVYPRYGQGRKGTAVAITVTEPFRWNPRVKADRADDHSFNVVKLNLVEDFPTGVYDYNLMSSVFVTTEPVEGLPAGVPVKLTFTSQEWCGHVWQQALFFRDRVAHESRSYFETEADENATLDGHAAFIAEDALFLWARGLAGPAVEPGQSVTLPVYRSAAVSRLMHVPVTWDEATLSVMPEPHDVKNVVLGEVSVVKKRAVIRRADGSQQKYLFLVEAASPHRVIRMSRDDGYDAVLVGVSREPYWSQNRVDGESVLENFGLEPRPARTP